FRRVLFRSWLVGPEQDRRAGIRAERGELLFGQELRDRRARLTVLAVDDVREPFGPPFLRVLLELLEVGARVLLWNGDVANSGRSREDLELRVARQLGRVFDLEPEAEIRLVG